MADLKTRSRTETLIADRERYVSRGIANNNPVVLDRGLGALVWDVDGREYVDFSTGIGVLNVGHCHPAVVRAVQAQSARLMHACFTVGMYEPYIQLCERLCAIAPGPSAKKAFLANSGAEAIENAVKIARAATGRSAVVAFEHAYHGRTNLTMALTAKSMPYKHGFGPFAGEVYRAPMAYPLRWPGGAEQCAEQAFDAFLDVVHAQVGEGNCAAVVVEPIQGEGGFIVPPEGWLRRVADHCAEHGIMLIADEIQTGFCRTGDWFASDHEGVVPDLITTAKGIAGGMPLAAVTGRAEVMDSVHTGGLGGTYGGNPVACAAALGAIATMEEQDLCGRAREVEVLFRARLEALRDKYDVIADVRGRGAMLAIELTEAGPGLTPDPALTAAINQHCHREGLVTLTCGTYGNVFRFLPPLASPDHLLSEGLDIFEDAFARSLGS